MKSIYLVLAAILAVTFTTFTRAQEITGRFAPPAGQVLVFTGQDNASVGGTAEYRDGYVENTGIPAGISHYIHLTGGWTNETGYSFPEQSIPGLLAEADWGAGPMHLLSYLESPMLDRCIIHLSLSLAGGSESKIADGTLDHLIGGLVAFVSQYQDHPFFIRIGHEFGAPGNDYDPEAFRDAFRRVVDALRKDQLPNFAIIYSSSTEIKAGQFEEYDPGPQYYDWIGYSWYGGENDGRYALEFARKVKKPALITEAVPLGYDFATGNPEEIWDNWFSRFFTHIESNTDVVRGFSYSNTDWSAHGLREGWGMSKIADSPEILLKWRGKMNEPMYINSVDKPFSHINFPSPYTEPEAVDVEPYAIYKDPESPIEERVADLLGRLTREQKLAQLTGWHDRDERTLRLSGKLFERDFYTSKIPNGTGILGPINLNIEEDIRQYNALLEYVKHSETGIPPVRIVESSHGITRIEATSFPSPIALSCSWNTELVEQVYRHIGKEAKSRGLFHVTGPNVNVAGDPRWGRVDETTGEDPFLTSRLGAAMVRGLRDNGSGVTTSLKNFAGSGNPTGGRNRAPYAGGKRQLLDTEIEPFRYIIENSPPTAIIPSFLDIDGVPGHANQWLLNDVLREKLGFKGLLLSEQNAILDLYENHRIAGSPAAAAGLAFQSGIHIDLPTGQAYAELAEDIEDTDLDKAVSDILNWKFRIGLFDAPRLSYNDAVNLVASEETTELATEAARESIVLLKNDGILPLDLAQLGKIAVIGPNADVCRLGSAPGSPRSTVSLLDGIKARVGDEAEVLHALGCMIALNDTHDSYLNWKHVNDVNFVSREDNQALMEEAILLAAEADVIILSLGENELLGREAWAARHLGDRADLRLPESQRILAQSILAIGKPVILYLNHGRPLVIGKTGELSNAILTGHYTGQESGTAAAEVLFGDYNPAGKLTMSWPRSSGHLPANYNQVSSHPFNYIDSPASALYPFGYGLSYTSFEYTAPSLSEDTIKPGQSVDVTFDITNTGHRAGTEIAQLYVTGEDFPISRPGLELKGFARVSLETGESRTVTIRLDADDLHFHNADLERVLPAGKYRIRVGGSSRDLGESVTLHSGEQEKIEMTETPVTTQPNFLFVAIDDLRPELGTYGAKVSSPHIDRLAASGVRFDNAYCQQPLSAPSRLSVMSGLYPTHTGEMSGQTTDWRSRHPDLITLNQHFRENGYKTIGLGKIYNDTSGVDADAENWDQWIDVTGPQYASLESIEALKQAVENGGGNSLRGPTTESADVSDDTYLDGKRAARASEVISNLAEDQTNPFLFAVGFSGPALPFIAPSSYWDLYQRDDFEMPWNSTLPEGFPLAAANLRAPDLLKYSDFEGDSPADFSAALNRKLLHGYAASVSYVDACLGKVVKALEDKGLAENTIVVLWSDNGWKLGDHSTWGKNTLFECDTRVPLIIRDPRTEGGKSTSRFVELVDLYPTLCDIADIPVPTHLQGSSFRHLLTDPDQGHRWEAYSSNPTPTGTMGHSIRYKNYRYSEWHDTSGKRTHRVLTDLRDDPGEVENLVSEMDHMMALIDAESRLKDRITAALPVEQEPVNEMIPEVNAVFDPAPANLRQSIDGFGGSIDLSDIEADDESLQTAILGLNATIIRARGEVSADGDPQHNREILQRAMAIKPDMEVLLTFWQPKSVDNLSREYWLDEIDEEGDTHYELKPQKEMEWAIEIAMRIRKYLQWGIKVETISVQNEANRSSLDTLSCRWEPERLADFIENKVQPALNAAGLRSIEIAAPDLNSLGENATEIDRYIPVFTSRSVNTATYHMYDAPAAPADISDLSPLIRSNQTLSNIRTRFFPAKRLWMTETSGSSNYAYGWKKDISEQDKAVKTARYLHTALVDAEANAFLWRELVSGESEKSNGLVTVTEDTTENVRTTGSYYTFRQYSGFIKPGFRRAHIDPAPPLQISGFLGPDEKTAVSVAINDTDKPYQLLLDVPGTMKLIGTFQTDSEKKCSPVDFTTPLPPGSVRTLIYSIREEP